MKCKGSSQFACKPLSSKGNATCPVCGQAFHTIRPGDILPQHSKQKGGAALAAQKESKT